jgi:hypothetical protein
VKSLKILVIVSLQIDQINMYDFQKRILNQMADMQARGTRMIFTPSARMSGTTYARKVFENLKKQNMKPHFNWQCWCRPCSINLFRMDGKGWHTFELGLIKIKQIPEPGTMLRKEDYKGFIIRFAYWFPIDHA